MSSIFIVADKSFSHTLDYVDAFGRNILERLWKVGV